MTSGIEVQACEQRERAASYVLRALPANESAGFEAHLSGCGTCRAALDKLQQVARRLVDWPINDMRPSDSLRERLAQRISAETGRRTTLKVKKAIQFEWHSVAPGISCKLLSTDALRSRVVMLVRLDPNGEYPPHTHADVEELHLLDGELWIDDRKLYPGDFNRAEAGTSDKRVWSETGCTCVLITSPSDVLS